MNNQSKFNKSQWIRKLKIISYIYNTFVKNEPIFECWEVCISWSKETLLLGHKRLSHRNIVICILATNRIWLFLFVLVAQLQKEKDIVVCSSLGLYVHVDFKCDNLNLRYTYGYAILCCEFFR